MGLLPKLTLGLRSTQKDKKYNMTCLLLTLAETPRIIALKECQLEVTEPTQTTCRSIKAKTTTSIYHHNHIKALKEERTLTIKSHLWRQQAKVFCDEQINNLNLDRYS